MTLASRAKRIQRLKWTQCIRTKHKKRIFGVIPFIKLQNKISTNKTEIVWIETELFIFLTVADAPHLSEGADSIDGQLRGDKECPFSVVNPQFWHTLEESAGKRCLEPHSQHHFPAPSFQILPELVTSLKGTEGVPFISAQLSTDAGSALRNVWVQIWPWKQLSAQDKYDTHPPRVKKKERKKEKKKERKKVLPRFKRFRFYLCWRIQEL